MLLKGADKRRGKCRYGGGTISAKDSGQGNNRFEKLTEEEILFISTIYGEAGGCSTVAWEAIANVIMNRVNDRHRGADNTVTKIIDELGIHMKIVCIKLLKRI